jgi:glycosyltransferase 2 family protein
VKHHAAKWLVPFLKYGVGFGLLAYVISKYWGEQTTVRKEVDGTETVITSPGLEQLLGGPIAFEWLLVAAVLMASAAGLQIYRWYLLVRALDLPFGVLDAYRLSLVGIFYNTFFPGSVGGDLLKAYFIAHAHPERKSRAVASVIIDRAFGLFGLILFVAVAGSIAWAAGDARLEANASLRWLVKVMAGIAAGSVLAFLLLGLLPESRIDRFAGRLKSLGKVGGSLAEMWYAGITYRKRLRVVGIALVLSAVSHVALVSAFHCASRLFPPSNPERDLATAVEHAVVAPIGFIVQAVPVSPGSVGVGEAAFAALYKMSDRPETRGVVARLSLRIVEWLIALVGYIVFLTMRAEVRELQHEMEDDSGDGKQESGDRGQGTGNRGQESKG